MTFVWPKMLWLLALLPLLVLLYLWVLKRKRKTTVRLSSVALAKLAAGTGPGWRRHVPPLLLLVALAALLLAVARPMATLTLPLSERTIMLAMDVSGSMRAEDVKPNRLVASQEAARAFVNNLPREVRVGVVSFAGTAAVVQAPTDSREDVLKAIDRFQLQRGTATGSGIILSLATLFPDDGIEIQHITGQRSFPGNNSNIAKKEAKPFTPVPPGSYSSAAVIMLTDGQRTTGPDPLDAAKMAAERGIRVYTVGIGTTGGEVIGFEGWSMRVRLDEETLKNISVLTHGEYFYAGTAEDLKKVYESLSSRMVVERKETEITALFAALGALLAAAAAGLSLWWFGRVA
ncbi:VWA domain-containing protein [Rubrivivax rivuli]|uniref:VWA domain-containing protein n=1 Tax=Rubrivivax rivuli TaxID=1862385 RepID=A0A437RF41_9BURK|nr:VWA domain-containing protein [Rubrivivax rivuli]RVU45363.1 VWA domain-containing protein [Rubrivivax rivuli]